MYAAVRFRSVLPGLLGLAGFCWSIASTHADDWPQFRGPDRTGISKEKGLLQSWPKEGPKLAWQVEGLGGGYSSLAIAGGRIYTMSFRGDDELVLALDETNGKEVWHTKIAAANRHVGYGEGPRCVPTVDGKYLYALGVSGDLACLQVADGTPVWQHNLVKEFGGSVPSWGYSESPLVDAEKVIATPGGKKATLAAFDKRAGTVLWQSEVPEGDQAQYASIAVANVSGEREYVNFLHGGLVGVAAKDGKYLWRYNAPANGTANCSMPVVSGAEVFGSSDYGTGGGLVKLTKNGGGVKADEVYFTKEMKNHHGGMVLVKGYLYGANGGVLGCIEFQTGKVMWQERKPGKGSIAFADGCLYYRNEGGPMYLVEANPEKYVEKGHFDQPNRSGQNSWTYPVVANGKLYLRDQDVLLCYDVRSMRGK
jgi:outer membrane protein assembly factor BamB